MCVCVCVCVYLFIPKRKHMKDQLIAPLTLARIMEPAKSRTARSYVDVQTGSRDLSVRQVS